VIEKLLLHPENLRLGGERKNLSIFFSDLQGFTTISEKMTPEQLTDLLNTYLTAMTDIITEENGTVDTYTMISGATFTAIGSAIACRKLGTIAVKGREHQPVTVYEPMPEDAFEESRTIYGIFDEGIEAFAAGEFQKAAALFDGISDTDPAARAYAAKCREFVENPPSKWQGIWVLTSK